MIQMDELPPELADLPAFQVAPRDAQPDPGIIRSNEGLAAFEAVLGSLLASLEAPVSPVMMLEAATC
jgi:hypothetical protein